MDALQERDVKHPSDEDATANNDDSDTGVFSIEFECRN